MNINSTFGERLQYLRIERGLTQQELADKIGISTNTISLWECDRTEPRLFLAVCLADALGVSLGYLATGRTKT